MPYKSSKLKLSEKQDKRIKLTTETKAEICQLYSTDKFSQRRLAAIFSVSRRTIQFTLDPKKLEENKKRREERGGWKQYYSKETHRETMKTHRRYKNSLHKKGEL